MLQDDLYKKILEENDVSKLPVDVNILKNGFSKFARAYDFTNEGLEGLMTSVDSQGKRILGVTGSADHMISSIFNGCEDYVGIDISIFACLFAELKFAALKKLDYSSFKEFFGVQRDLRRVYSEDALPPRIKSSIDGVSAFSEEIYTLLREELSKTAREFFDNVIGYHYISSDSQQIPFALQYLVNTIDSLEMGYIPYLKAKEAYDTTQKRIQRTTTPIFRPDDIRAIDDSRNGDFDIIYLSNVPQHLPFPDSVNLIKRLSSSLKHGGVIVAYSITDILDDLERRGFKISKAISPRPRELHFADVDIFPTAYLISNS